MVFVSYVPVRFAYVECAASVLSEPKSKSPGFLEEKNLENAVAEPGKRWTREKTEKYSKRAIIGVCFSSL